MPCAGGDRRKRRRCRLSLAGTFGSGGGGECFHIRRLAWATGTGLGQQGVPSCCPPPLVWRRCHLWWWGGLHLLFLWFPIKNL